MASINSRNVDLRTGGAPRGESAVLLKHGQSLYQQGHLKGAVGAFTEALKDKDADVMVILDSRAGVYDKLAQHDLALRDAKQMIKRDKTNARGYLRCAKTLLLDGKPHKALEVYAYGLRSLPKSDRRRQSVELLHNKLRDKLSTKLTDPFSVLPLELANMVLEHFNFKQIAAILRVSKKWEQFLSSKRDLWLQMDLSNARGKIHWSSVRAYIRRSKGMLTRAIMKNVSVPSMTKVLEFLGRCPQLEHFEIWDTHDPNELCNKIFGAKRLKTFVTSGHTQYRRQLIVDILHCLPNLERLEVHNILPSAESHPWPLTLPKLKSITFGADDTAFNQSLASLYIPALDVDSPYTIPNLEELRLNWYGSAAQNHNLNFESRKFPRVRRLDLTGVILNVSDKQMPPNLEFLRLRAGDATLDSTSEKPLLPNLKTLILSDVNWLTDSMFLWFVMNTSSALRSLSVDNCMMMGEQFVFKIVSHFKHLEELNLTLADITDNHTDLFLENLLDLKVINLSHTKVTGTSIKMFADARVSGNEKTTKIERVYVKGCERISSDAVAYGRAKGIHIIT